MSELTKELVELVWGTKSSPGLSDTIFCRWTQGTPAGRSPPAPLPLLREPGRAASRASVPSRAPHSAPVPCPAQTLDFLETACLPGRERPSGRTVAAVH